MCVVSVVVPARNEEPSIGGAIAAINAQDYPHELIEVVVVDGNSTDLTADTASAALQGAGYRRTAVLHNPIGSTPTNLNMGLEWCEGDLVVRVDARSRLPRDYISSMVSVMEDPTIAVAGGSQVAVARSAAPVDTAIARALNNRIAMGGSRYRRLDAASGPADTAYLGVFRRAQLEQARGWNVDYATNQDFELNQRMRSFGSIWFQQGLPVGYLPRQHVRGLLAQYSRFGRWKAAYWRGGHRPQSRQLVLIGAPTAGLLMVPPVVVACVAWFGIAPVLVTAAVAAGSGVLAIDGFGGHESKPSFAVRALAGSINMLIGASWYAGVVRQYVRPADLAASTPGRSDSITPTTRRPSHQP